MKKIETSQRVGVLVDTPKSPGSRVLTRRSCAHSKLCGGKGSRHDENPTSNTAPFPIQPQTGEDNGIKTGGSFLGSESPLGSLG